LKKRDWCNKKLALWKARHIMAGFPVHGDVNGFNRATGVAQHESRENAQPERDPKLRPDAGVQVGEKT
jgi:hypothetical protein